jgi:hypothetical protein
MRGFHGGDYEECRPRSERRLLVTANVVLSSLILVTLMIEALRSSETSVITRATRRNIQEDGIHQSLFTSRSLWNTDSHSVSRMHRFCTLQQVVHIATAGLLPNNV